MTQYSKAVGFMDIHDGEESIILTGGDLDRLLTTYAVCDVFKIHRIGISSDPATAADFGTKVETYPAGADEKMDDTVIEYSQSFKAGNTDVLTVALYLKAVASFVGTLYVSIQADAAGDPDGTPIGTDQTLTEAGISTTKALHTFTFPDCTGLTDNNTYHIVVGLTAVSAGNVEVYGNPNVASNYADGCTNIEPDAGGWDAYANADIYFRTTHTAVVVDDADIDAVFQSKTGGGVDLAADQDENALMKIWYSSMYLKRLDDYLDTYTGWHVGEHVLNALAEDPRMFWLTVGILLEQDKIEISHNLVRIDPSGGTHGKALYTLRYKCRDIDNLCIHGA